MPVVSLDGFQLDLTLDAASATAQVVSGAMNLSAPADTMHTLGGADATQPNKVVSQTAYEASASCVLLYDGADGVYQALFTALTTFAAMDVVLTNALAEWTGNGKVTDLGAEFDAGGGKIGASASFTFEAIAHDEPAGP